MWIDGADRTRRGYASPDDLPTIARLNDHYSVVPAKAGTTKESLIAVAELRDSQLRASSTSKSIGQFLPVTKNVPLSGAKAMPFNKFS